MPRILDILDEKCDCPTIISAGHSLGGGLAQQAAYSCERIKRVFAFAPSPVTGFYSVKRRERRENKKGIHISRIFEHEEVLAYFRFALRNPLQLRPSDPRITEV